MFWLLGLLPKIKVWCEVLACQMMLLIVIVFGFVVVAVVIKTTCFR